MTTTAASNHPISIVSSSFSENLIAFVDSDRNNSIFWIKIIDIIAKNELSILGLPEILFV